jgi:hypothetical protein
MGRTKWLTSRLRTFKESPLYLLKYLEKVKYSLVSSLSPIRCLDLARFLSNKTRENEVWLPFNWIKPGSTPLADLLALALLTKVRNPKVVFEIGTFEGMTAVLFAKNGGERCSIFTLDLPQQDDLPRTAASYEDQSVNIQYKSGYLISELGCNEQATRLFGDSALFDFGPYIDAVDLFFVDGAHSERYVIRDTLSAFKSIKPDGWVVWHDCLVPQVAKVIKKIARYQPVYHLRDTNLALTLQKPGNDFPWNLLEG